VKASSSLLAAAAVIAAVLGVPTAQAGAEPAALEWAAAEPSGSALEGFSDIVADPTHGHIFISEGAADRLTVANLQGQLVGSTPLDGPSGMVLSPDASTLYVALSSGDAIAMMDTSTGHVSQVSVAPGSCPSQVAVTADALWFGYGCDPDSGGNLGEIDLDTLEVHSGLIDAGYSGPVPILAADPINVPGALFVGQPGPSVGNLYRYEVTGGSAPTAVLSSQRVVSGNLSDLAIDPTGSQVTVAARDDEVARRFATADLTPQAGYRTGVGPGAVAFRHDGLAAFGRGAYQPNLEVFKAGYAGKFRTYQLGDEPAQVLQPAGLAFGPVRLFAVTGDPAGRNLELNVVVPKHLTTISIRTNKPIYRYNEPATVRVHLGYTAAARLVTVSATPYGGASRVIKRARVDETGNLILTTRLQKRTRLTATFAGDSQSTPAQATSVPRVRARLLDVLTGHYGRSGSYHLYHLGQDPVLKTTVLPKAPGACVYFRGQYLIGGVWKTLWTSRCGRLDAHSHQSLKLIGEHWPGEHVRMRPEWRNHAANLASVGRWQYARFTAGAKSSQHSATQHSATQYSSLLAANRPGLAVRGSSDVLDPAPRLVRGLVVPDGPARGGRSR